MKRPRVRKRAGWERLSKPPDICFCGGHRQDLKGSVVWRHTSGWEVKHCGHPTAIWPYYVVSPQGYEFLSDRNGKITGEDSGRGFRDLLEAMEAVEHENNVF